MPTNQTAPQAPSWLVLGHHDVDGIVSAAIAGAFLRAQDPSRTLSFGTVDFHLQPVWRDAWAALSEGRLPWRENSQFPAPDGLALVDFPWLPVPADLPLLYADHHATAFAGGTLDHEQFQTRLANGETVMHSRHGSCALLLLEQLSARYGWTPPASLLAAANIAHQVDTAGYGTPDDALDFRSGKAAAIDLLACSLSEVEAASVADDLSRGASIEGALFRRHAVRFGELRVQAEEAIALISSNSERLGDDVVLVDGTREALARLAIPKFSEYGSGALHAIKTRMVESPTGEPTVSVSLGRSPWAPASDGTWAYPDLGKLASAIGGGGGHPYAAGFRVTGETPEIARRKTRALLALIAPHMRRLSPAETFADQSSIEPPVPAPSLLPAKSGGATPSARKAGRK